MKHRAGAEIRYRPVDGVPGLETLCAERLRLRFDRHFHDAYAFGLVLAGVEQCAIRRTEHFFEPGTVPLFNPGEVHDGGPATEAGWSYRMVYVDPALVRGERAFPRAARRDPPARERVADLFDAIDCGSVLGIEETLERALDALLGGTHEARFAAPALERVRERIDADCCGPLRLRELAALAGVSPTRLLRAFEAAFGLTPHRYQQSRRIARARRMLVGGSAPSDVAAACGYADQSHLNRWFVRVHGTTPGRFRRAFFS